MKQLCLAAPLALCLSVAPAVAQDATEPPSLMERGAQMFFEGLLNEMSPAMEEIAKLLEETGPALKDFVAQMGPKLEDVLQEVEDWSVYEAPEVLPNGDIIIRRKPEDPEPEKPDAEPEGDGAPVDL